MQSSGWYPVARDVPQWPGLLCPIGCHWGVFLSTCSACYSLARHFDSPLHFQLYCLNVRLLLTSAPVSPSSLQHPPSACPLTCWVLCWLLQPPAQNSCCHVNPCSQSLLLCSVLHLSSSTVTPSMGITVSGVWLVQGSENPTWCLFS